MSQITTAGTDFYYSVWRSEQGRITISADRHQEKPVVGYLIKVSDTVWTIEGDTTAKFDSLNKAAEETIRRYRTSD